MNRYQRSRINRRYDYRQPGRWKMPALAFGAVVAVILILGGCAGCFYQTQLKQGEVTFTVQSKERVSEGNSGSKYLVFSTANEAYQVTDNILFGKTDSSNRYAALREGETYTCKTVGIRFSLFSMYKNLIDCKEVSK